MEKDFHSRIIDLATELLQNKELSKLPVQAFIAILRELAQKYDVSIEEKDWGEKVSLASRRYQIWFNDPHSFEGGVYGESEESIEKAFAAVPITFMISADVREVK
jgi:hypothetical protein